MAEFSADSSLMEKEVGRGDVVTDVEGVVGGEGVCLEDGKSVDGVVAVELAPPRYLDIAPLSMSTAVDILYCGVCSLPCEYCVFGQRYEECTAWRSQLTEADLVRAMGIVSITGEIDAEEEAGAKKGKKGIGPKKKAASTAEARVTIARIQRQKRKFITQIVGLDTIPDLNLKDIAKAFGKRFASGCSVGDLPSGGKEVVIQGDVWLELPEVLVSKCKIDPRIIFIQEDPKGAPRPYME